MWRLLLFFSIVQIVHCSCPSGFELVNNVECRGNYTRVNTYYDETTATAVEKCEEILGKPIIIHNDADQKYWSGKVRGGGEWTPIGLVCNSSSLQWEWVDGSLLDYKPPSNLYISSLDNNCNIAYNWVIRSDGFWSYWSYWSNWSGHGAVSTDVFCSTPVRQPVPSADGCNTFEDDSEDGICYQIGATAENWQEAQMICRSFGADVASVHSLQENSFIRRLAVSKGVVSGVFLGATLSGKGNEFGWIDGSKWDYQNFFSGFPISGLGDCLVMNTEDTSGEWVNADCSLNLSVACKRSQNYTTPACSSGPWKEGQIIYSPGFPFDASTPCEFILSVDAGKKVEVEVLFLEAYPCCDHMLIYENYVGNNVIANLTGEVKDKFFTTSSSNFMRVSWQPNGGVNVRGMMITFRGV